MWKGIEIKAFVTTHKQYTMTHQGKSHDVHNTEDQADFGADPKSTYLYMIF